MLNIYCGKTLFEGYTHLMKRLKDNRKTGLFDSHIFVVPDRFSMACEKDIFDYLNIESTFDISVLTMSRFASQILGSNVKVLPKTISSMIVQKILIDNKKSLKCFHKTRLAASFAKELFETINQLKSCGIKPQDINISNDDFLAQKMTDIKFIYEKYEDYLKVNNLLDSADKFTLFERYLPEAKSLKNSCIYISHFDSFTKQGYAIVKKFIENAKQVNISVTKSEGELNSHIYLNDVYANVVAIAQDLGKEPNIFECNEKLSNSFEHIKNNLFSYNPKSIFMKDNNVTLSCHNTFVQECEFVATAIKKKINEGDRFKNIAVAMPNLEGNKDTLARVFDDFGINAFFDVSTSLTDTIIDKLIQTLIMLKVKYFKKEDIIKFIKSPIVNLDQGYIWELENYIQTKNIEGKSLFREDSVLAEFRNLAKVYLDWIGILKTSASYSGYCDLLLSLFEQINLKEKLDKLCKQYYDNGYIKESKKTQQIYNLTISLLDGLKNIFGDTECDIYEFLDVLKSGFEAVSLSVTPISVDSVFVGDSSSSIFERAKHLFVIGAKEGELPIVNSDCGLITDREIDKLSSSYKIEPSIKTINQRERFKLFNLLTIPTDSLHISYSKGLDEKTFEAGFVKQLRNMFYIVTAKGKEPLEMLDDDYNYFTFCEKLGSMPHAEKILAGFIRNIEDGVRYTNEDDIASLFTVVSDKKPHLKSYKNITNYKKENAIKSNLFFSKGTISVSEAERYYACPFKHFVDYGLKLKENRVESFDNMQVGNFLHKVAEVFVKDNIGAFPLSQKDIVDQTTKICDKVLDSEEFSNLKENDDNILSIISIKKEAVRMCKAINYQIESSEFRPILTEARFDSANTIKSVEITVDVKKLKIVGAIDRVDAFDEYFRIIDYKTGKCDSSLKELYFGKKLQLYVYQHVTEQSLKLKPAGAYYFPVKNSFNSLDESGNYAYKLKGYTDSSDDVIIASDKNLNDNLDSDIISVSKKKGGGYYAKSEVMESGDILALAEYAMEALKVATSEILSGNITPTPLGRNEEEACKYCPYKGICRFDESMGDRVRTMNEAIEIETIRGSLDGKDWFYKITTRCYRP